MAKNWFAIFVLGASCLLAGCNDSTNVGDSDSGDSNRPERPGQRKQQVVVLGNDESEAARDFCDQPRLANSIVIGLDADMSSAAARSGESIRRGIMLAIHDINQAGGLLGRTVELVVRDHRGNPERGIDNILEFTQMKNVLAVVGGLHTPVALRELDVIHDHQMIYLGPWAAGTPIVDNGFTPNFVFRVSVRDAYAGGFLIDRAVSRGMHRIGLLLERTAWGRSNEKAMVGALRARNLEPVAIEWFNLGESDLAVQLSRIIDDAQADGMILVCNPLEGVAVTQSMASHPVENRVPILSHWGITGGNFSKLASESLSKIDLSVLQTHSFFRPKYPTRSQKLFEAYRQQFSDCQSKKDIFAPVGTAHAYDLMKLLAIAVENAGSTERRVVRSALEKEIAYQGILKDYVRPFSPDHHDALTGDDFILAKFASDGSIRPIED
jgi:branched-chain amino acid transport system substrate-binding protein